MTNATRWVGIDLHRRRSQIAIIDEHGELTLSGGSSTTATRSASCLATPDGAHVALEATYGWEWLADLLTRPATTCTSRTRCAPRRSPPRG